MADKERIRYLFTQKKETLNTISLDQGITRERVRQLLKVMLGDEYDYYKNQNRIARPHKFYKKQCECGRLFKTKAEINDDLCPTCKRKKHEREITREYTCEICGKVGTYKHYEGRAKRFCSKQCQGKYLYNKSAEIRLKKYGERKKER